MFRIPRVRIFMRELDRLKCIQGLIDKQLKQKAVAERLGLTVRPVQRLVERLCGGRAKMSEHGVRRQIEKGNTFVRHPWRVASHSCLLDG
jgi:Ni,Fe-hydrogenase III large subunit